MNDYNKNIIFGNFKKKLLLFITAFIISFIGFLFEFPNSGIVLVSLFYGTIVYVIIYVVFFQKDYSKAKKIKPITQEEEKVIKEKNLKFYLLLNSLQFITRLNIFLFVLTQIYQFFQPGLGSFLIVLTLPVGLVFLVLSSNALSSLAKDAMNKNNKKIAIFWLSSFIFINLIYISSSIGILL